MQPVALPLRSQLFDVGEPPRYVHLLTSGQASIVAALSGGQMVEVSLVGRDGFPEALHLLGPLSGEMRCFMQVEGTALRMEFRRFKDEFERNETLRNLVLRYVQYGTLITSQLAACNRLHDVEQRLARWLLMAHDRVGTRSLPLTHDFLAIMLGTDRPSVTLAAGVLQQEKAIQYGRAAVDVLDREKLEMSACECYGVVQQLNGQLGLK